VGASNDSWIIENVDFQCFWTLYLRKFLGNKANVVIHGVSKKTRHQTLVHILDKYWPIFTRATLC